MSTLLVLDFDGVICDSVEECYESSREARFRLRGGAGPVPEPPADGLAAFARMRPFVRNGEDFLVMLDAAERGVPVPDQAAFDALAAGIGPKVLRDFKARFYDARERLLAEERSRWLRMNRIFPHARAALLAAGGAGLPLAILSTKRSPYILEILSSNGIPFSAEHVHHTTGPKAPVVRELLAASGCGNAVFIDDQIDYLLGLDDPRIEGRLASWGYVRPEWLVPPLRVRPIDPDGLAALVVSLGGRP
ncbi:MAG: HAD family hydrolase [Spirochaetes bacterium]|nr:HAD family hydrolase [Spirochaetota bacterium]